MKRALWAVDVGAERVLALAGEKQTDGTFQILGAGRAPTQGFRNGEVSHLGDAVESVVRALGQAESASGLRARTVYFNFDDPEVESVYSKGSKALKGEGQIRPSDIEDACEAAERLVEHFDKSIIYSKAVDFLVDDRDYLVDPLGVYGRKLDVQMHIVMARAAILDDWLRIMRRTLVLKAVPVFSAWSTALGVIPEEERRRKTLLLDAGRDFLNISVFGNNIISAHRTCPARGPDFKEWVARDPGFKEICLTGDLAGDEKFAGGIGEAAGLPVRRLLPWGIQGLTEPGYASAAGLLRAADAAESKIPILYRQKGLLVGAKEKALSLINEYF